MFMRLSPVVNADSSSFQCDQTVTVGSPTCLLHRAYLPDHRGGGPSLSTSGRGYLGQWQRFFVYPDVVRVADVASRRTRPDVGLYREPVRIIVAAPRDASDAGS